MHALGSHGQYLIVHNVGDEPPFYSCLLFTYLLMLFPVPYLTGDVVMTVETGGPVVSPDPTGWLRDFASNAS